MFGSMEGFSSLGVYRDANDAVARIISFFSRKSGWRYGRGKRPGPNMIINALLVAEMVSQCGASKTGAFLNEDGSILVTGYYKQGHAEILCLVDQTYNLAVESLGDILVDECFSSISLVAKALTERVKQWGDAAPSFVSITSTTSTLIWGGFKAGAFQNLPMMGASQSFASTALLPQAGQFVNMREQNTTPSQANRRFFGNSTARTFLVAQE
jgi:hypothetical protein